ncbi:ABC transporter substrate-binding protein [Thiorhodococcus mannitoliphagus]|uniref:ABC transporter substrate-binding protein n=1 Tax=Thiorhodococcus mannitoliphagus TaxID=329406 RepID=A0A6P1DZF5_9GAMM|nr:ABC transporter substrate-binding protein [Thiorhodococcus mannitoliphagus]NEX22860.1 ABC transporter substrate-binding protein [Thiorhodococcus mannitoliphagus]
MKSRLLCSAALLAVASVPVSAQPQGYGPSVGSGYPARAPLPYAGMPGPGGANSPAASAEMAAVAALKEGMDKLLAFLEQGEAPNNLQVAAFLDREIAPYFDFDYMAQWVAGRAYEGMQPEEKKALAAQLESDFLSTLARNLLGLQGQQIRILRPRRGPRGSVNVNVAVMQAGGQPTRLEFRMSDSDDGWKVYDVVANGQSAASYYRVEFQRTARQQLGYVPR